MRKYNIQNYLRYKEDVEQSIARLPDFGDDPYTFYSRDQLIVKFMPLVENLAKKFSTSPQAVGVLSIMDLIQFGHIGLIKAVDRIDFQVIRESEDKEKTIKSFRSSFCHFSNKFFTRIGSKLGVISFANFCAIKAKEKF